MFRHVHATMAAGTRSSLVPHHDPCTHVRSLDPTMISAFRFRIAEPQAPAIEGLAPPVLLSSAASVKGQS